MQNKKWTYAIHDLLRFERELDTSMKKLAGFERELKFFASKMDEHRQFLAVQYSFDIRQKLVLCQHSHRAVEKEISWIKGKINDQIVEVEKVCLCTTEQARIY